MRTALCIPTYNHCRMLQELLAGHIVGYRDSDIDIFVYDSSENDDTEAVVSKYRKDFTNIYYKRVASDMHSNTKVYLMLQDIAEIDVYDYAWVCRDSLSYDENAIRRLRELQSEEYDYIVINNIDREGLGDKEYDDPDSFISETAWYLALYGGTIVRVKTVLNGIDWSHLSKKYLTPSTINFSHVCLYAERALNIDKFRAFHATVMRKDFVDSVYSNGPTWKKDTFDIWFRIWPNAIMTLPCQYEHKKETISRLYSLADFITRDTLIELRAEGIFTEAEYKLCGKNLLTIAHMSDNEICEILDKTPEEAKRTIKNKEDSLYSFCREHSFIAIYGAGMMARMYYQKITEAGFKCGCFIVTDLEDNNNEFMGCHVLRFSDIDTIPEDAGIIIGLKPVYAEQVLHNVMQIKRINDVWCGLS